MSPQRPAFLTGGGLVAARIFQPLLLAAVLVLGLTQSLGDFLQPIAVTVTNGEEVQDALINGNGLDDPGLGNPDASHVAAGSEMWTAIGSIRAEVVFDLGATVDLTKVYIWNYDNGGDTDRGMKDVQILTSSDSNPATAKFTGIATVTLTEGGDRAQAFAVVGTNVRLVKLRNTSNWGNGYAIGLAEVRFESGDIPGSVPVVSVTSLKNGDVVPLGSDFILAATVTDADGDLAKVEFFDGATKLGEDLVTPFTISLKTLTAGEHTLRVVATDSSGKLGWVTLDIAVREIVPGIVVQIDDQRDILVPANPQPNTIRYSGNWTLAQGNANDPRFLNNDHYSDQSGAYFEVKFVGVKIDVFGTVASHHGTATALLDGGTRYTINYKATQRAEQKLVWSSPLLPNKEHTLRVTVAGTGVVTADRFDVTQSDTPSEERALVKRWEVSLSQFLLELEDLGTSKADKDSVKLFVDGAAVAANATKAGALTTVIYAPATPFAPGSQHPFRVEFKDTLGNSITNEAAFSVPAPPFPLTGLGEPAAEAGLWSVRQVWNGGRADAVVTGVGIADAATKPGFAGRVLDAKSAVINFGFTPSPGGGGLFPGDEPFPGEADGLVAADWITVARAKVRIPRAGDWTIGVHSDDGFSLRFVGHPFSSVSGLGVIDEFFPEYVTFAVGTGDSNTRAVLAGLAAGDYVIEFIQFQRNGGAFAEIYAAEGAFAEDADATWALIGAPDGLELVADELPALPITLGATRFEAGALNIDFTSSKPADQHQLEETTNFASWGPTAGAVFTSTGGNGVRATVANPTGDMKFYRVRVP